METLKVINGRITYSPINPKNDIKFLDKTHLRKKMEQQGILHYNNYTGKLKFFQDNRIPLDYLQNHEFFLDFIETLDKNDDYKKRFLYMLAIATKGLPFSYFLEYNKRYAYNKIKEDDEKIITPQRLENVLEHLYKSYEENKTPLNLRNIIIVELYKYRPLRLDYNAKINQESILDNYYNTEESKYYLNTYKTDKYFGKKIIDIPTYINEMIQEYYNLMKNKFKSVFLLMSNKGKPLTNHQYSNLLSNLLDRLHPIVQIRRGYYYQIYKKHNFIKSQEMENELKKAYQWLLHTEDTANKYYNQYNSFYQIAKKIEPTTSIVHHLYNGMYQITVYSKNYHRLAQQVNADIEDKPENIEMKDRIYEYVLSFKIDDKIVDVLKPDYVGLDRGDLTEIRFVYKGRVILTFNWNFGRRGLFEEILHFMDETNFIDLINQIESEVKTETKTETKICDICNVNVKHLTRHYKTKKHNRNLTKNNVVKN